jgi:hypothetical protein
VTCAPDEQEDAVTRDLKGAITDQKMMVRTPIELAAFAAWINVAPTEVPDAYTSHVNSSTMAAWKRVADAVVRAAAPDMADRIEALGTENARLREALTAITTGSLHPVELIAKARAALNGDET